ncbi:MAG: hypothetical protein ACRCTJ_01590 [Brevinema sp.]
MPDTTISNDRKKQVLKDSELYFASTKLPSSYKIFGEMSDILDVYMS